MVSGHCYAVIEDSELWVGGWRTERVVVEEALGDLALLEGTQQGGINHRLHPTELAGDEPGEKVFHINQNI